MIKLLYVYVCENTANCFRKCLYLTPKFRDIMTVVYV